MPSPHNATVRVEDTDETESESSPGTETGTEETADTLGYTKASTALAASGPTQLAPIRGREDRPPGRAPPTRLPPMADIAFTRGGSPQKTQDTIISVPEGGAASPELANDSIISVPGVRAGNNASSRFKGSHIGTKAKPVEIVVYFQDKTGLHLKVEDGQRVTGGELFEMVMEEMKFPNDAREIFSLWLVSDLLELQLKPNHIPFKLVCYWEELLEKYTTVDEDDRERDEPVIVFQRNVFYPRSKEKKIDDPELISLLYHEAKEQVIDGRYPVKPDQYDFLAGLQALIKHKLYDESIHTPEYYRDKLKDFFPVTMVKTKWKLPGIVRAKDSPEFRIAKRHRQAFSSYGRIDTPERKHQAAKTYLEYCWKFPFYGAAFFRGQIEHTGSKFRLSSLEDDPVYIAVNTDGVFVLDMDDVRFLMGLTFKQLNWEYAEPRDKDNPDCMPCLFLSFNTRENEQPVTKMLQVFTREAVLVDALIEACIKLKKQEMQARGTAAPKGGKPVAPMFRSKYSADGTKEEKAILQATGETWERFNRMCLATFSRKGKCINNPARVPKPN